MFLQILIKNYIYSTMEKTITFQNSRGNQIVAKYNEEIHVSDLLNSLTQSGFVREDEYIVFKYKNTTLDLSKTMKYYSFNETDIIYINSFDYPSHEFRYLDHDKDPDDQIYFNLEGEDWRKVKIGLNLLGNCKNENCSAYDEEVIYPIGFEKFEFLEKPKARCPICDQKFIVKTCALYKCGCSFKGFQFNKKTNKLVDIEYIFLSKKPYCAQIYEPFHNSDPNVSWTKLAVEIINVDSIQNMEELLVDRFPQFIKEITLLNNNYPINKNTIETWNKTDDEKGIYLRGESKEKERGVFIFRDNYDKFIGNLLCGEMEGEGAIINKDNNVTYKGTFKRGKKHGKGKEIIYKKRKYDMYEGTYKNDKFEGNGVYHYANGNRWEGKFKKGKRHGMGNFFKEGESEPIITFYYNDKLEWNFTKTLNEKIKWRKMSFDDEKVGN